MDINTIIAKKRIKGNKGELTRDEIRYFVGKYAKGEISDAQAAVVMSYIYQNGLTEDEIVYFVQEAGTSGDVLDLTKISTDIADKHSTGGIGDKTTLILMPVIASLGVSFAKISSKGSGVAGGTIDRLCAIPGFNPNISTQEFIENVSRIGMSIASEEINLAPAEQKMYNLRNEIACQDSVVLIAISLLSLKVATGANNIVFDITCGKGSYLKDKNSARRLGKLLVKIGKRLDKKVGYAITDMNQPIGKSVGNNLEIKETIDALNGKIAEDVLETVMTLGNILLKLTLNEKDDEHNKVRIQEAIKSGKALTKFRQMVIAQGGDEKYISEPEKFEVAKNVLPVYSPADGFIEEIDPDVVGSIARFLGVGNPKMLDNTAGIVFEKKVGDEVKVGDIVAYVHSNDGDRALRGVNNLIDGYKISDSPVKTTSRIIEVYEG